MNKNSLKISTKTANQSSLLVRNCNSAAYFLFEENSQLRRKAKRKKSAKSVMKNTNHFLVLSFKGQKWKITVWRWWWRRCRNSCKKETNEIEGKKKCWKYGFGWVGEMEIYRGKRMCEIASSGNRRITSATCRAMRVKVVVTLLFEFWRCLCFSTWIEWICRLRFCASHNRINFFGDWFQWSRANHFPFEIVIGLFTFIIRVNHQFNPN